MRLVFDPIWPWPVLAVMAVPIVALVLALYDRRVQRLLHYSWAGYGAIAGIVLWIEYRQAPLPLRLGWVAGGALAGVLVAYLLESYHRQAQPLPGRVCAALVGLRLAAVALLALAMIRPALVESRREEGGGVLYVLSDASRSMTVRDGPGSMSRREWLLKTLAEAEPKWNRLGESLEVRFFDFAEELVPVERPEADAAGRQTAMGAALEEVRRASQRERVVGVVLLGDGAHRALPPRDTDPREAARRLAELQVPIYTVGFGSEHLADVLDVAIEEMQVDPLVYEKKLVPVSVRVRASGAQNRRLSVRLLVEDRRGKAPGQSGEMKLPPVTQNARPVVEVEVPRSSAVLPIELSYVPEGAGEFKIAVEVAPLEGELKTENNRRETIVSVQSGGLRIAYFDVIRPEQKYLRKLNETENIQLDFFPVRSGTLGSASNIRPELFQPDAYDVYLIGDVGAETFGQKNLEELARRVDEGAGLLMIGGLRNFGAGGYANTPLARLLPVQLAGGGGSDQITGQQQMVPTDAGLRHYVMRLGSDAENRALWSALAPLEGATRLTMKRDRLVEVLAESATGVPLLFHHQIGNARVMAFAADTTYQWVLAGHEAQHQRFWRQMVLYLAGMEDDSENPVWVRVDPRNYAPGQKTLLQMGARDENRRPINHATFDVYVTDPDGTEHRADPRRIGDESHADFNRTAAAGDYWVRVVGMRDGRPLGGAWTRFIVDARDLELDDPAADFDLLDALASSGRRMQPDELGAFLDRQAEEGLFETQATEIRRTSLWDNWPFLLLFTAVVTAEWVVRKRNGLA